MLGFLFPHLLVGIDMIRVTSLLIKQTFNEYIQKHQSTPMRNICGLIKKKKKRTIHSCTFIYFRYYLVYFILNIYFKYSRSKYLVIYLNFGCNCFIIHSIFSTAIKSRLLYIFTVQMGHYNEHYIKKLKAFVIVLTYVKHFLTVKKLNKKIVAYFFSFKDS